MTYQKYSITHSPAVINKPSIANSNILADWQRAIQCDTVNVKINGKLLSEYAERFNNFQEEENLKKFFKEIILAKLSSDKLEEFSDYLMKSLHQGGLMYPVSSALRSHMREQDTKAGKYYEYGAPRDGTLKHNIAIVSTESGFKVQEFCQAQEVVIHRQTSMSHLVDESNPVLTPDPGKEYILKAQGTIDVDFLENNKSPTIGVESNTIDFGNKKLKEKMDSRSLTQIIIDFFKNLFGFNKIVEILPPSEDNEDSSFRLR